jgi:cyclic pyranopterin monophosphate synthase
MAKLSHTDKEGRAKMVDITEKQETCREALAVGSVSMKPATMKLIQQCNMPKGDVLSTARIAGIMAAKRTSELIPMCHPLNVTSVSIDFKLDGKAGRIDIEARVRLAGRTGVEMEALVAVSVACLTVYDMCKSVDRNIVISDIMLKEKSGGKSGVYKRK